jgi:hypothetical protein
MEEEVGPHGHLNRDVASGNSLESQSLSLA